MQIYHNPRCRKSREGLAILEEHGAPFEVVKYMDDPPDQQTLKDLLAKLGIPPIDLVRKGEAIWKSDFKGKDLDDDAIIQAMAEHPRLIERPIVVKGDKAVIGRPPEKIRAIL